MEACRATAQIGHLKWRGSEVRKTEKGGRTEGDGPNFLTRVGLTRARRATLTRSERGRRSITSVLGGHVQ